MDRADDFKNQAFNLFKKTVTQLEDLSRLFVKTDTINQIKSDAKSLIEERDRLFRRLGEECFRLIESNSLPVPKSIRDLYKMTRSVLDDLMNSRRKYESTTIESIENDKLTVKAIKRKSKKSAPNRSKKPPARKVRASKSQK